MLPAASVPTDGLDCLLSLPGQRVLSDQMIESMDGEIGRVLVETGLATRRPDGSLNYDPIQTDTMIVIVGAEVVLLQLETPIDTVRWALAEARRLGKRTVVNPRPRGSCRFPPISSRW